MKISVPKIYKKIDLGEYAAEMAGIEVQVHVNPPRARVIELDGLTNAVRDTRKRLEILGRDADQTRDDPQQAEMIGAEGRRIAERLDELGNALMDWYALTWGWPVEDVRELVTGTRDTDPGLFAWMTARTRLLMAEHRDASKKV